MATKQTKSQTTRTQDDRLALLRALDEDATAHLLLAWRRDPPEYEVQYVELDQALAAEFLEVAQETADDLMNHRSEVPYDPEWQLRDHEYFELGKTETPAPTLFRALDNFLNLDNFTRAALTKPRLYVVAVQTRSGTAYFGKRMAYLKVLGRQRSVFTALWDGDTFNKLDKSVATFARNFDWVRWKDWLWILDSRNFHAEFRDSDAVKAAVVQHVAALRKRIEIRGADAFIARCQASVPMASKLQHVAENGIYDRPIDELKKYAKTHKINVTWDGDALVFDGSIDAQWDILKLLDEDRTDGPVSGRMYESSSKRTI